MNCLLCNKPFGDTITLGCGHTFDKMCLRQDFFNKSEILEPCTCPICLKPYDSGLLINVYIPNAKIQRERILEIQNWVTQHAHNLDRIYGREHPRHEYTPRPTKESMNEATLMGKQLLKQRIKEKEEKQEALIQQKQIENEVLKRKQIESEAFIQQQNEVITRQEIESDALIQQQEERIQELERELERRYNNFQKGKGKVNRLFF